MIWPHDVHFPYRLQVLRAGCVVAVLGAFCWPGLTAGERVLTGVIGTYGLASGYLGYGLALFCMRWVPSLHVILSYLVFYGTLASLVAWAVQFVYDLAFFPLGAGFQAASLFTLNITILLGAAAAAFNAIHRNGATSRY